MHVEERSSMAIVVGKYHEQTDYHHQTSLLRPSNFPPKLAQIAQIYLWISRYMEDIYYVPTSKGHRKSKPGDRLPIPGEGISP